MFYKNCNAKFEDAVKFWPKCGISSYQRHLLRRQWLCFPAPI